MCGRFGATFQYRDLKAQWNLQGDFSFYPRYNIAPSQEVPVIVRNDDRNELRLMKWGLVPSWAPDRSIGQGMINARSETLLEKPSFKTLVSTRRCLVPADGFYEWRRDGNRKVPMWIYLKGRKPFTFPGLWDCLMDRDSGKELYTFTIITTRPNELLKPIHDRMPVIYDEEMGQQWLDPRFVVNSPMALSSILQPLPSELMEAYEVSRLVNSPEMNSPACIEPAAEPQRGQMRLL